MSVRAPFLARLERIAAEHPRRVALESPGGDVIPYGALAWRVTARAAELREAGVADGDWVIVARARSWPLIVDLLAVAALGAAFLPLDDSTPAARRRAIEQDAKAGWRIDGARGLVRLAPPGPPRERIAYVIYTSGSSGIPKGVRIPHGGLVPLIEAQIAAFELGPGKRTLAYLSPSFDAFLSDVLTTLLSGATLVFERAQRLRTVGALVEVLRERRITHLDFPPSLLAHLDPASLPRTLETMIVGGEAAPVEALRALARRVRVINVYGPTEATICTSMCVVDPATWDRPLLGDPLPGVTYRIEDEELWIASAGLALGYVGRDEETARAFVEREGRRFYRTGDRVRALPDGRWEFLGRLDRQVKLAGQRIELDEVETVLRSARPGDDLVVVLRPEGLVVFFAGAAPLETLRERARRMLPPAAVPRRFVRLAALPRTTSGKLDRNALRELPIDEAIEATEAPRDADERAWAALFARVLGRPIGRSTSFWDAGGDSLAVMELAALAEAHGMPLSPARLAEHASIAELARASREDPEHAVPHAPSELASRGARVWAQIGRPHLEDVGLHPERAEAILLTGATGFLGSRTLAALLARTDAPLYCLVRASSDAEALRRIADALSRADLPLEPSRWARVTALAGDVTAPHLGLAPAAAAALARSITQVVHAAGRVAVTTRAEAMHTANVEAVAHVARFARSAGARVVHASSLAPFACAHPRPRWVAERDLAPAGRIAGHYAASKLAAEHVLHASGVSSAIVRFGLLTGDSTTGRSHDRCQLSLFLRGLAALGVAPSLDEALALDITPVDSAARAFAAIVAAPSARGTFHVAAPSPSTLDDLVVALEDAGVMIHRTSTDAFFAAVVASASRGGAIGTAALGLLRHLRGTARALETDLFLATGVHFETTRTDALLGAPSPAPSRALLGRYARAALERPREVPS